MSITEALTRHTDSLLSIPGVVGVGEGRVNGEPAIQILVTSRTPDIQRRLPRVLDGYPVDIVETGVIEAQPDSR